MRIETQPYSTVFKCIAIRLCRTAHAIFSPKFWNDKMNFTRVFVTVSPRRPWDRGCVKTSIHSHIFLDNESNKIFLLRERQTFFSKNCKFQITIFRLLHSPLHFVHVVSSYAALIKTPKGVKYSSNPRLCQHCLIACLPLRLQAGILSIFKSVISCNTLKKLHLI